MIAATPLVKIRAGNRNDRRRAHPSHYGPGRGTPWNLEALASRLSLRPPIWKDGRSLARIHGKRHSPDHRGFASATMLNAPRVCKNWRLRGTHLRERVDPTTGTPSKKEAANAIEKGAVGPEWRSPFRDVCCSKSVAFARIDSLSFNVLALPPKQCERICERIATRVLAMFGNGVAGPRPIAPKLIDVDRR